MLIFVVCCFFSLLRFQSSFPFIFRFGDGNKENVIWKHSKCSLWTKTECVSYMTSQFTAHTHTHTMQLADPSTRTCILYVLQTWNVTTTTKCEKPTHIIRFICSNGKCIYFHLSICIMFWRTFSTHRLIHLFFVAVVEMERKRTKKAKTNCCRLRLLQSKLFLELIQIAHAKLDIYFIEAKEKEMR